MRRVAAVAVLALFASTGCSIAVEGKMRASMLKFIDRETKPSVAVDTPAAEEEIVLGLLAEANGDDSLAVAFLKAKGYSDDAIAQKIATVRAKTARR